MNSEKNILILSNNGDISTTEICKWLKFTNSSFIRINYEDTVKIKNININDLSNEVKLVVNDNEFELGKIKSFWYRRGKLNLEEPCLTNSQLNHQSFNFNEALKHVQKENSRISDLLYYLFVNNFASIRALGDFKKAANNKLIHLGIAKELKITIPDTYIVTEKSQLLELFHKYKDGIITKAISDSTEYLITNNGQSKYYAIYTNIIPLSDIHSLPEKFPVTLIQPVIEKKLDIRVFYLNHKFYSMAIFSQEDSQTSLDFRRYNFKKPNRAIPFKLPKELESKLDSFMNKVGLNTGSIDIIYGKDKKFYFLEVNPIGQFGMVSVPCNYFLEKEIAGFLSNDKIEINDNFNKN
jgi:ATP-GRASP peptide maturase of grasp-with-spasm system